MTISATIITIVILIIISPVVVVGGIFGVMMLAIWIMDKMNK